MIRTDTNMNEKTCMSSSISEPQPVTWMCSSFTSMHTNDKPCMINHSTCNSDTQNGSSSSSSTDQNHTDDENIDWDFVTRQLETKLRTLTEMTHSQSEESDQRKLPSEMSLRDRFHPITNHESTVTKQTSSTTTAYNDNNTTLHSVLPHSKTNLRTGEENEMETNMSRFPLENNQTSTLRELFNELTICQQKQRALLEQIQRLIKQSSVPSASAFFLPLNTFHSSQDHPSLQHAFQQRKSSFIHQSKQRVNEIYRQHNKHHQRIIPNIQQSNNTYLQQRRQVENDRLCAMIIKHQNRQNAKIYGNLIKNQLCHN